jgi:hypothetical protein
MIDLTAIINHIQTLISTIKKSGTYDSDEIGQIEEWTLGNMYYCDNIFLGESLEINEVQVWNNW